MLSLSLVLCEKGRRSYSLSLVLYAFHLHLTQALVPHACSGFHSTHPTPAAHHVLLACSVAKSFTNTGACDVPCIGKLLIAHCRYLFVSRHTRHTLRFPCLDFLLRSQPPSLRCGVSGRLAYIVGYGYMVNHHIENLSPQ
jgi:hypothetical protein